jgi:hypothetical protein
VRYARRTALLALIGACLAAAGCGADEEGAPIPADSAATLQNQLNSVEGRILDGSVGACEDVSEAVGESNTDAVQQAIDGLPGDVDQDVRDALQQGFDRLFELVQERCAELAEQQETDTETTPEVPPETETETTDTTETFPTETETTPTDTTEEPTTPTTPETPSDEGGEGDEQGGGILAPGDEG